MNISVIIPVYNAAEFLESSVHSALQFPEVKEVLLIEDGSTDNSWEVARKISEIDNRIKLLQHPNRENRGAGATRNLGLENATQDFIAFLDADDYYLPNRFDAEKELFQNPEIDGVFGAIGTEFLNEENKEKFQQKFQLSNNITGFKKLAKGQEVTEGLLLMNKAIGSFFHLNSLTIRKDKWKLSDIKFNANLKLHQDQDFIIKLSNILFLTNLKLNEIVAVRRVHGHNRITKIKNYSKDYNHNQYLLWDSLKNWSDKIELKKDQKEHISLKRNAFLIANKKGLIKIFYLIKYIYLNPKILKTRYRFNALNF